MYILHCHNCLWTWSPKNQKSYKLPKICPQCHCTLVPTTKLEVISDNVKIIEDIQKYNKFLDSIKFTIKGVTYNEISKNKSK